MHGTRRPDFPYFLIYFALSGGLVACSASPSSPPALEEECGGQGHLHGSHCHCDEGYEPSVENEFVCVARSAEGLGGAGGFDACRPKGNLELEDLPRQGSVAFLLVDGEYRFLSRPGMEDTSISFVDSSCTHAYGWSRDKQSSDETARTSSWVLDLETMKFTDLDFPEATSTVLRGARDDGTLVGKLWVEDEATGTEASRGFWLDGQTGEIEIFSRKGHDDIGFTAVDESDRIIGFNDFGAVGFVFDGEKFTNLTHADAFRLFPFQINKAGWIVGFWGQTPDHWHENSVNPSFVARPTVEGYRISKFEISGYSGVGLTGLNDLGQIAGIAFREPYTVPVVFRGESLNTPPQFFPLDERLEPFATGISSSGLVYGQAFILTAPPLCGGHGVVEDESCICDEGYGLDPLDPTRCLSPDEECSGRGHLHGEVCHCDEGFKVDPVNSARCISAG